MFVYESKQPIDYFHGMTKLKDYIKLCDIENLDYPTYFDLEKFLIRSFVAAKCCVTNWEGDIRDDNIFISAIPANDNETLKLISFKQDNGGLSFIVSEFELPKPKDFILMKLQNLVSPVMMEYFEESFDLTRNIFEKSRMSIKPTIESHIINTEDEFKIRVVEKHEEQKEVTTDKFNMKNYRNFD